MENKKKYMAYDKKFDKKFRRRVSTLLLLQPNLFKLFDEVAHQALNKIKSCLLFYGREIIIIQISLVMPFV